MSLGERNANTPERKHVAQHDEKPAAVTTELRETGDTVAALHAAREAVDQARHSGRRLMLARALTVLSDVCETVGDVPSAADHRSEAETLFDAVSAPRPRAARPDRSRAAQGVRPPLPDDAEERFGYYRAGRFGLTHGGLTEDGLTGSRAL
ncbi:hypothetical protein ACIQFU_16970 [Streptomyces sp. NPDC093065]|uniref:hypothetical protein n=1 Tax=Streptomyces sp. NPDC093065 TaxID=3366021 RepID=UPI003811CD3B